jgi:hypothetical protein
LVVLVVAARESLCMAELEEVLDIKEERSYLSDLRYWCSRDLSLPRPF